MMLPASPGLTQTMLELWRVLAANCGRVATPGRDVRFAIQLVVILVLWDLRIQIHLEELLPRAEQ